MSMSSYPSSQQTPRTAPAHGAPSSGPAAETTASRPDADQLRRDGFAETMSQLSRDMASLKDTFALLASQAGGEAANAMRNVSQTVASQFGTAASGAAGTGSDLAAAAKEHAKTFASELEAVARRNPLGTIAATLLVGIVIGMMSRGRG